MLQRTFWFFLLQPTIRDYKGNTPLHLACEKGDLACVRALTVPIAMTEIQDVFRTNSTFTESSSKKKRNSPCLQLPGDLDMRNYDGKLFFFLHYSNCNLIKYDRLLFSSPIFGSYIIKNGNTQVHRFVLTM